MMLNAFFLCLLPPRDLLSQKDIAYFKIAFVCIQLSFECSFHILGKVLCWIFVFQILSFMFSFPWQYLLQSKNFNSCKILCIIFSYIDDAQGFFFHLKCFLKYLQPWCECNFYLPFSLNVKSTFGAIIYFLQSLFKNSIFFHR